MRRIGIGGLAPHDPQEDRRAEAQEAQDHRPDIHLAQFLQRGQAAVDDPELGVLDLVKEQQVHQAVERRDEQGGIADQNRGGVEYEHHAFEHFRYRMGKIDERGGDQLQQERDDQNKESGGLDLDAVFHIGIDQSDGQGQHRQHLEYIREGEVLEVKAPQNHFQQMNPDRQLEQVGHVRQNPAGGSEKIQSVEVNQRQVENRQQGIEEFDQENHVTLSDFSRSNRYSI